MPSNVNDINNKKNGTVELDLVLQFNEMKIIINYMLEICIIQKLEI